nr:MAG TPA: repressor regulating protein [Caudoviricetes sp.]
MGKTNMVEIDIHATREAIDGSGKTMAALSEEIGRCPSYLCYTVKSGRLPEYAFRRLCVLLGVSECDLLKKQEVTPPSESDGGSHFGL